MAPLIAGLCKKEQFRTLWRSGARLPDDTPCLLGGAARSNPVSQVVPSAQAVQPMTSHDMQ
eukprot:6219780-Amphidinium_carterae.1